jgi:hypothetical protein
VLKNVRTIEERILKKMKNNLTKFVPDPGSKNRIIPDLNPGSGSRG